LDRRPDLPDLLQISVWPEPVVGRFRQQARGLGGQLAVQLGRHEGGELLLRQLLLEQRAHDDRRGARVLQGPGGAHLVGQGRGPRQEWMRELQSQVLDREIHGGCHSSAAAGGGRTSGMVVAWGTTTLASCSYTP